MLTERQNIDRTYDIAGAGGSTVRTVIYPAVFAPLPAYGTRLRGIGFADGDGASCLVIQLLDECTGAGSTHLLRLYRPIR